MRILRSFVFFLLQFWFKKSAEKALAEAVDMFPGWWEKGPKLAATAAVRRDLGVYAKAKEVNEDLFTVERAAKNLAAEARVNSAIAAQCKRLPNIGGLHDGLLFAISEEDVLRTLRRSLVARYGINPDGLEMHFAKMPRAHQQ